MDSDFFNFLGLNAEKYNVIQENIKNNPEDMPCGGVSFGQIYYGDVCYYSAICHVPPEKQEPPRQDGADVLNLSFFAFVPGNKKETCYMNLTEGYMVDYIPSGDITFSKEEVLRLSYGDFLGAFTDLAKKRVNEVTPLQEPAGKSSGFWNTAGKLIESQPLIPTAESEKKFEQVR